MTRQRDYLLWMLTLSYMMSQFFRSYVAVLAPQLFLDYKFSPTTFGFFAGSFFMTFALAQVPLGIAFDRFGIGRPITICMVLGTAGAVALPLSHTSGFAIGAQALLGIGCAPLFMGLLNYVLAAGHGARQVGTVTAASAIGMAGAVIAAFPLAWASSRIGWRTSMDIAAAFMAMATLCIACTLWRMVPSTAHQPESDRLPARMNRDRRGVVWSLFPICFAMAAGATFRTSWGGPYFSDVFQFGIVERGNAMTAASVSAFAVSLSLPVFVRIVPVKTLALFLATVGCVAAIVLTALPARSSVLSVALICLLFCVGAIHPLVMSQARAITQRHRLGVRLGVLNSMVFLGIAVTSNCFGWIATNAVTAGLPVDRLYSHLFLFTALVLGGGVMSYIFSPRVVRESSATVVADHRTEVLVRTIIRKAFASVRR